ncbi:hypothetical protein AAU57_12550 [Nonlabens sp. YIK11]|uniref:O-antigen polysaccharide polymerase Wzy n=1 Tax=Nonlabens sp. YIK11 TaxID=1453349 RepID=UPI0006DC1BC3|nr:O-antigen polysaccharide polymerase Wzy [Nonlabens sp. YIK11]KQC34068.1 hypothetical protein AAU57_12550 [Nonlabens sp. YIK11]
MQTFLQLILYLISLFTWLMVTDVRYIGVVSFWTILMIILIEVYQTRKTNLFTIFLFSFLYMIPTEAISNYDLLVLSWGRDDVHTGYGILLLGAGAVMLGYKCTKKISKFYKQNVSDKPQLIINKRRVLISLLLIYEIFFFAINIENTIYGFTAGRASAFPFAFSGILYVIAFLSIGLFLEYFKGNKLKTLLFILPIIITFLGTGTRFFLLFIVFIFFFKDLYYLNFKNSFKIIFGALVIITLTTAIKSSRASGLKLTSTTSSSETSAEEIMDFIASKGSDEGLIRNTAMITDYLSKNEVTYGKSIGFIFVFWIPRSLWPDKPVMLDNWLVNKYFNVSEGYSSASSFAGELYMDFGFEFALLALLILGVFLFKLEDWILLNHHTSFQNYIFSGFLMGWLFFATRSILTATFILITYMVFSKIIFYLLGRFKILIIK